MGSKHPTGSEAGSASSGSRAAHNIHKQLYISFLIAFYVYHTAGARHITMLVPVTLPVIKTSKSVYI